MPTILNSVKPAATTTIAKPAAAKAATASSSSTSSTSASGLGTTFLSLLAQELQNQDPTAPVDPTAMVGQMISLNQLEQLISINQGVTGTSATASSTQAVGSTASSAAADSTSGSAASMLSPSTAAAASNQLPFDPNTMMPLGSSNSGAVADSINSSMNAAMMGFSGTSNNTSGGK
jgi:flagellar basal-body rod modification protein FlgD